MKRILSIILAVSLIFGTVGILSASADAQECPVVMIEGCTLESGNGTQSVKVPVTMAGVEDVAGAQLKLIYSEGLQLQSVENGPALDVPDITFTPGGDLSANPFVLLWDGLYGTSDGNGIVATLTFAVPVDRAKAFEVSVEVETLYHGDDALTEYPEAQVVAGVIEVIGDEPEDPVVTERPIPTKPSGGDTESVTEVPAEDPTEVPQNALPFTDVSTTDYYYDAVKWAVESEVTVGVSDTAFAPKDTCTRGQVLTFLWRAAGEPEPQNADNPFEDVSSSDYYYKPILWAVEKGITKGTSDTEFSPQLTCSSAHIITFIYRVWNPGKDGWYEEAKEWAEKSALLLQTGLTVTPDELCPRGATVQFIYRTYAVK